MHKIAALALALTAAAPSAQASLSFSTFVNGSDIAAVEGYNSTIAFNYAGNKFVGSVYTGANNLQLFQTDLTGGSVQLFGSPMTNGYSGEVVVGASLGQAGFATGDIYAGAGAQIYHYANTGGSPALFANTPDGSTVRQILFDPGSGFGGKMLVTTSSGKVFSIDSAGNVATLASLGVDAEGMDIATSNYGQYAGQLLVANEGTGQIKAVDSLGNVTTLQAAGGGAVYVPSAETVSVVPVNLGASGNPLEGFYVANYPQDIQYAGPSQFAGMQGNAIITSEDGSNARVWELTYNGDLANTFNLSLVGNLPNQSEDGIFVTAQRLQDVGVPEPASLAAMGVGLAGLGLIRRRRART